MGLFRTYVTAAAFFLWDICKQPLRNGFNSLRQSVLLDIERSGRKVIPSDQRYHRKGDSSAIEWQSRISRPQL